jgi:hypothetical protein
MQIGDLVRYDLEDLGIGLVTEFHQQDGWYWVYFPVMDDYYPFRVEEAETVEIICK